jgi:acetate kinase
VEAADEIVRTLQAKGGLESLVGIGHRVVHSGVRPLDHQRVTPALLEELRAAQPLDLAHLPAEIALIEAFGARFPTLPQVACFDAAFHRSMPRRAQLLPIPRRFDAAGVRRLGFHGLSYAYLLEELARAAGAQAARGRIILAHLGAGASLAAVRDGQSIDTSMAFTPSAGLVMATRPGDLDPGVLVYLQRTEGLDADALDELVSRGSGLLGVSGTTGDMQDLLARRSADPRAAEAVDLFCYQARKWIGAFAAALGGLETLVFAGGIGENAPAVRAQICDDLGFLGLEIDPDRNRRSDAVISSPGSRVTARTIRTDEELMVVRIVQRILHAGDPP